MQATQALVDRKPTGREIEIAQLIVNGFRSSQIAKKLKISTKTVEAHRSNLYRKLQIGNVAQLIQIGVTEKFLELPKLHLKPSAPPEKKVKKPKARRAA